MYSIFLNSEDRGYSFRGFSDKFLEICRIHRNEDRALAFAFILYDFENPQISKILNDTDYWLSLNAISGRYLTVFSFHYKPRTQKKKHRFSNSEDRFDYLKDIANAPDPSSGSDQLIAKYFGNLSNLKYPSVLFFQVHNGYVIDSELIQLDQSHIEDSFSELKGYISAAANALKKVTDENKGNSKEIFDLIRNNVKGVRAKIVVKRTVKTITSISELASTISGLIG